MLEHHSSQVIYKKGEKSIWLFFIPSQQARDDLKSCLFFFFCITSSLPTPQSHIQNQLLKIWQITDLKSWLQRGSWSFDRFFCSGNHFNKQFQYTLPSELSCARNERKIIFHLVILNGIIFFQHFKSVTEFSARPIHREFQPQVASTWENKVGLKPAFQWNFQVLHHIDGTPSSYVFNCFLSTNKPRPQKNTISPETPVKAGKCQWKLKVPQNTYQAWFKKITKMHSCTLNPLIICFIPKRYYFNRILNFITMWNTLFWITFCYHPWYCTRNWVQLLMQTGFTVIYTDHKLNWILHSLLLLIES